MKFVRMILALSILVSSLWAQDETERPLNTRKLSAKELRRRTDEAFRNAEKASQERTAWTARFRMFTSNPFDDVTVSFTGRLWVKNLGEEGLALYWEREKGGSEKERFRALYRGNKLRLVEEKSARMWIGIADPSRRFWFEVLIREGFRKELENLYTLDLYANAKYQKTVATPEDWKHLGFDSKEDFEQWWNNKRVEDPARKITYDLAENRPFRKKEDEFDRKNPRNIIPKKGSEEAQKYYGFTLTPKREPLKREIRLITMTLRPGDFLPSRIYVERTNDFFTSIHFEEIEKDPEPEIPDERFKIEESGLTIINAEE